MRCRPDLRACGHTTALADKQAKYKIPREWVFATSLPRTPTGKLQKFLLR